MAGIRTEGMFCSVELSLGLAASSFNLGKAVCSHGLFMMAPNRWDPLSRSLSRPLRFPLSDHHHHHHDSDIDGCPSSVTVRVSHTSGPSLCVQVFGVGFMTPAQRRAVLAQVSRMLRLSDSDERNIAEFRESAREEEFLTSFDGRVFRSPNLFEDMVKCILLCNCQFGLFLSR